MSSTRTTETERPPARARTFQHAPFVPARFLGNTHAQTIFANLFRKTGPLASYRQRIDLADGDFVDVDVAPGASPEAPWVLVLHGLEGSSQAPYVRGLARALVARGFEACLMNYRGCSGEHNRLPRSYHSGETADVLAVFEHLARSRQGRPCALVGFSIGANLSMKLLGEMGPAAPPFEVAIAVSPPFELEACARHLDLRSSLVYRERLLFTLRKKALAKIERHPGVADPKAVKRARTFFAFDEHFTARIHGFENAVDYWSRSSGGRYLDRVERDLVIITSSDDPFFPRGYCPEENIRKNPRLELVLAPGGGHVGFVSGTPLAPRFWAEEQIVARLAAVFTEVQSSR